MALSDDLPRVLSGNVADRDAVAEGVAGIGGKFPLYAGLFLADFKQQCIERELR
jgi:hypothetical protein